LRDEAIFPTRFYIGQYPAMESGIKMAKALQTHLQADTNLRARFFLGFPPDYLRETSGNSGS
jgi:hypothetical protein